MHLLTHSEAFKLNWTEPSKPLLLKDETRRDKGPVRRPEKAKAVYKVGTTLLCDKWASGGQSGSQDRSFFLFEERGMKK